MGYPGKDSAIFVGMMILQPQAVHPLAVQDMTRILAHLQNGPATAAEVARALRLTVPRTNGLLMDMEKQGLIQVDRCTTNSKGMSVNVWVCRESIPES